VIIGEIFCLLGQTTQEKIDDFKIYSKSFHFDESSFFAAITCAILARGNTSVSLNTALS
jgi:hypothetical protein